MCDISGWQYAQWAAGFLADAITFYGAIRIAREAFHTKEYTQEVEDAKAGLESTEPLMTPIIDAGRVVLPDRLLSRLQLKQGDELRVQINDDNG
jgi:hypothetical protein